MSDSNPPSRRGRKRLVIVGIVAGVVVVLATGFFLLAPGIVEGSMNRIESGQRPEISERARTLHDDLVIVDLHTDTLLWDRDLLERGERGHSDLPRLEDGNVALQVLSSVTKSPSGLNYQTNPSDSDTIKWLVIAQLQPLATWFSLLERSLYHADKLEDAAGDSDGRLRIIEDEGGLVQLLAARAGGERVTGALLSIEGLHNLEGRLEHLDELYEAGFRMAGLVHFFDNRVAGSMHGERKMGLRPFGRKVLARMEELGMIVDLAHCSNQCIDDVLAIATRPLVSSHGGVRATCDENRNLTDEQIRGIADTGGLIAIGFWEAAVCDTSPKAIAAAIAHVRDVAGIEHVALGSDFDGAVTTGFDVSELAVITQALLDRGFSEAEIRQVMGQNAVAFLRRVLR